MNQSYILKQEIIENYRIICANKPSDIENWLILGRYLIDIEAYDEAESALTKIFEEGRFFKFKKGVPRFQFSCLFSSQNYRLLFAKAYSDLAMISLHQTNLAEAERLLIMALKVFEKTQEDFEYARASNRLGMIYRLAGAFESAEEAHYRAKELAEKNDWKPVLAETLGNLGMVYEGKENFSEALNCHQEALNLYANEKEFFFEQGCVLRQMGFCALANNQKEQALSYFQDGLSLFEKTKDDFFQSRLLNDISLTYQGMEELETALKFAIQALKKAKTAQNGYEIASSRLRIASLKIDLTPTDSRIEPLLLKAIAFFQKEDKKQEQANACATLGLFYLRLHSWQKAESLFKDSLRIEQRLSRSLGIASDYCNLGLIAQEKGEPQKAVEYWQKASLFFENSGEVEKAKEFYDKAQIISEAVKRPLLG